MTRPAAGVAVAASGLVLVLAALPYALGNPSVVATYFGGPIVGPPLVALFAGIAGVATLAGVKDRSDPATAAGIAVAVGAFAAGVAWWWALGVDPQLAAGVTTADAFQHHRWLLAIAATLIPLGAAGYARAVV